MMAPEMKYKLKEGLVHHRSSGDKTSHYDLIYNYHRWAVIVSPNSVAVVRFSKICTEDK